MEKEKYAAVILAAGKGTRMNKGKASPIPKVMFELLKKPIVWHSIKSIKEAGVKKIVLVVGYKSEMVKEYFGSEVEYAIQEEQLGTGHAVMMAENILKDKTESIIVFYGDCPLYKKESIKKLIDIYENPPAGGKPMIAMLSVISDDPTGYGRIIREGENVVGIIEHKDCTDDQLKIKEWNPGFYIFNADWLWQNLSQIESDNFQKEYYLTDMIEIAQKQGKQIVAIPVSEEVEALGINTPEQLKQAEVVLKNRDDIQD